MTDPGASTPAPATTAEPVFEPTRRDGVLELARPGTTWLSTGWRGGRRTARAAYNVTVPEGWSCDEIEPFVTDRLAAAGFGPPAGTGGAIDGTHSPVLLTGVSMAHARGARLGPVEAYATVGLSNPAALPTDPAAFAAAGDADTLPNGELDVGTVNVVVGTHRALQDGALANLVAIAAEARAATLLDRVGVPGTTSDAIVAATDPDGDPAAFSGSATRVGAAARACVRDAITASLESRYAADDLPTSVADARYGVETDAHAVVFDP